MHPMHTTARPTTTRTDPWDTTRRALERDLRGRQGTEEWIQLRHRPLLARFDTPEAVVAFALTLQEDRETKNLVLGDLVAAAQHGSRVALVILTLALWPGLCVVRRRWRPAYRGREAELSTDVASTFVLRVHRLDLGRTRRIAATLCRNTEHDLRAAHKRARLETPVSPESFDSVEHATEPPGLTDTSDWIAVEAGADAELIMRVMLGGEAAVDVAEELGLAPNVVWQRLRRASARLRRALRHLGDGSEERKAA